MKNKKVLTNVTLNLFSCALPIALLQLIILPGIARHMTNEHYGLLTTVLSFISVLPSAMGNTLNNIRLLQNEQYTKRKLVGDFNILVGASCLLNLFFLFIFVYIYFETFSIVDFLLVFLQAALVIIYEYFSVSFRLNLDYVSVLKCSIVLTFGYGLGYIAFILTGFWQLVYIFGYSSAIFYIFQNSTLWQETLCITPLFRASVSKSLVLFGSGLLTRFVSYADKLLIYPILGGTSVAIYYVSTLIGKMINMIITPMGSVALSYLTKIPSKKAHLFERCLGVSALISLLGYGCCLLACGPVLQLIYPQYVDSAMPYIYITSATALIGSINTVLDPFILRYCKVKWEFILNLITLLSYVSLCLGLLSLYGMMGFCVGALLANVVRLLATIVIYQSVTK